MLQLLGVLEPRMIQGNAPAKNPNFWEFSNFRNQNQIQSKLLTRELGESKHELKF